MGGRRSLLAGAVMLMALAPAGVSDAGDEQAPQTCTWSIGIMGALEGDFARYGTPMANAIRLAVDGANREGDLACELVVHAENTSGDPNRAPRKAQLLTDDEQVVACVCGFFSGETLASGSIFSEAGLAMLSTGTNRVIDRQGFETWFRVLAADPVQARAGAHYIFDKAGAKTVSVVHDNQDYSKFLAERVADTAGKRLRGKYVINPEETDYSAVVEQIAQRRPDAVYYGGYWPQAGALLRQLRDRGVGSLFVVPDGSKTQEIGRALRHPDSPARMKATCPCSDAREIDSASDFVTDYEATYGKPPRGYAADAFDAANIAIDALGELTGSESTDDARAQVVAYLDAAEGFEGTVKDYRWNERGELEAGADHTFVWKWLGERGRWEYVGRVSELI